MYLERLEVVERPEVGEDSGLLGFRVVEAVEALSRDCSLNEESWTQKSRTMTLFAIFISNNKCVTITARNRPYRR